MKLAIASLLAGSAAAFAPALTGPHQASSTELYARKPFISGNWKLNPQTKDEAVTLAKDISASITEGSPDADVALFVPYVFIESAMAAVGGKLSVGAEGVCPEGNGAYTGAISTPMLKSIGVQWALAGHSERRVIFGETDDYINAQCLKIIDEGMSVMLCIGESLAEFEQDLAGSVCAVQLKKGLKGVKKEDLDKVVIAYEPVWAIGTGKVATPEIAQDVHATCRAILAALIRRCGVVGARGLRTHTLHPTPLASVSHLQSPVQRRSFSEFQPTATGLLGAGNSPAKVGKQSPKQLISPEEIDVYPVAQVTTLPSGLRVATETSPRFPHTATIAVFIEAGSRHETRENNGTAHFLEHLAFKGTQRRDKDQLEVEVESLGGSLNAYTSREQTAYIASCGKEDIPQFVDILSDVLLNSKFSSAGVDRERSTILREMEEVYKEKEEYVMDQLHDTAFLEHPLGQTILGPVENIRKITREDLRRFIETHYTTDRMVVCGVGAVDHKEFCKLVEEKFAALPRKPAYPYERVPAKFTGSDYTEEQDDMEMGACAIAYPTAGWTHPDTTALQFMNALLGTWVAEQAGGENSSSLMVTEFAGKRLGTKIMSATSLYRDVGLFTVYFEFYEKRASHACWVVAQALRGLHLHLTEDQVDDVRNQLTANMFSHLDTTQMICDELGRHLLCYGRRIHPTEQVARLNAVTCGEIKEVAHKYMWDKEHALAMVGPIFEAKHLNNYSWWRRKTYGVFH